MNLPFGLQLNHQALEAFCRQHALSLVILFGSRAQSKAHAKSDLDLALLPREQGRSYDLLEIIRQLHDIFGGKYEIDPVILTSHTDPVLQHEIFSGGIPLYEERQDLFVDQNCRAWMLFQDTARLRQYRKNYLDAFVKNVPHGA